MENENQDPATPSSNSCCGPDCDCNKPPKKSNMKIVVPVVVLLAAAGILGYKLMRPKPTIAEQTAVSFTNNSACIPAVTNAAVPEQANQAETAPVVKKAAPKPIANTVQVGESLASLASLNTCAMDKDAVFILIPAKDDAKVARSTADVVTESQKAIEDQGITVGVYTLSSGSPEYANLAAQVTIPGLLVMSKGKSAAGVKGDLTKDKIIQAFVASSRASGCGPSSSGCGPATPGCN